MIEWMLSSSLMVLTVLGLRAALRGRISLRLQYALWLLVLLRLLIPGSIGSSRLSVENYLPTAAVTKSLEQEPYAEASAGTVISDAVKTPDKSADDAPAVTGGARRTGFPIAALLKLAYGCGAVLAFGAVLLSNLLFYARLCRSRRRIKMDSVQLPVYMCPIVKTPCLFGLFRPCVYLTADLNESEFGHVISHELCHYRHLDNLWSLLRCAALCLHWYNPLVWLAAVISKRDCELACDEGTIARLGEGQRLDYGRTLIALSLPGRADILNTATTMTGGRSGIRERISLIAHAPRTAALALAAALLVTAVAAGCAFTGAEPSPAAPVPSSASVGEGLAPPVASPSAPVVEGLAPPAATAQTPVYSGTLADRNGKAIDLSLYPELSGAAEAFGEQLAQGRTVSLTVDLGLQDAVGGILERLLGESGGTAAVVRVKTGEPLAIVGSGTAKGRALTEAYQPKGLFLPCTAIAALSEGTIKTDDRIDCEGVFTRYAGEGYAPECWIWNASGFGDHLTHPDENVATALRDCCQYYFYVLGNDTGSMDISKYAAALGLGESTGIELPESVGNMDRLKDGMTAGRDWTIHDTLEAAVGRGDSAFTPLQYAEYCAALANRGLRYSASILQSTRAADGTYLYERAPQELGNTLTADENRLLQSLEAWQSGETELWWDAIQQGMYDALNSYINDHNRMIWVDSGVEPAGMTYKADGVSLFMGYAPFDSPEIAVFVAAEQGDGRAEAQSAAREIFQAVLP